ncbi:MAG: hypothetical protein AB7H90_18315 [Alphaproteobacteria bacterium]
MTDRQSEPQGLGMHGVRLNADVLLGHATIEFSLYFPESDSWEGEDHHIALRETGYTAPLAKAAPLRPEETPLGDS